MSWLVEHWLWVAIALGGTVLLALARHRWRGPNPKRVMQERMDADGRIPLRRWCQAACMLVTRNCDYGHLRVGEARRMLQRWWHVHGARELRDTLDELSHSRNPDNAWELLRFLLLARLGTAAGMLSVEDCWEAIAPVAARLQRAYDDWPAMAQAYVHARRQWLSLPLDGSEDDPATLWIAHNLPTLRDGLWAQVPYALDLEIS